MTEVQAEAKKCKHCGEFLDEEMARARAPRKWNPGTAAVLSLLIPGAGQIYRGRVGHGFAWMAFVVLGYGLFFLPGFVLHILCVVDAYKEIRFGR